MATQYSGTSQVDDSILTLMDQAFLISGGSGDNIIIDQFVDYKRSIGAKSIDLTKYAKLAKVTSALSETVDPDGVQMSDTKVTLTPAEYGNVVTTTKLASIQSGGKADLGASAVVGMNAAESLNALGIVAGEAGTNVRMANSAANEGAIAAGDTVQAGDLAYVYNRLSRANVLPFDGGFYVAIVHPDVADDIALISGWSDVQKYADAFQILKNEVGMYKGFRFIKSTGVTVNADAGASAVDTYHSQFFGRNALGKAVSRDVSQMVTGPFDKLQRFVHLGWYGMVDYSIIDQDAHWLITSSSSYGSNS